MRRPDGTEPPEHVRVTVIPREQVRLDDLAGQVQVRAREVARHTLGAAPWTLEAPALEGLYNKMRQTGVPLSQYLGSTLYRGIVTGANDIFVITQDVRDRLVAEDPKSAEIIRPSLRGREVQRWSVAWGGEYVIFARRGIDIGAYPAVLRYLEQYRDRLEPKPDGWEGEWPGRKPGNYEWYEVQDAIEYWRIFEAPKIAYTDLAWEPSFALIGGPMYPVNTVYVLPTDDLYLLGVLNSPLVWSFMWNNAQHGKDEVLRLFSAFVETIPIPLADDDLRGHVGELVGRVVALSARRHQAIGDLLEWLRVEFRVDKPGKKLREPWALTRDEWIQEVRKRGPGRGGLTSAQLARLRAEYDQVVLPLQADLTAADAIEREIHACVVRAYQLTTDDERVLWENAPPRTPLVLP